MTTGRAWGLVLCAALLGACGGDDDGGGAGDEVDAVCDRYVECEIAGSREECTDFFDQVFADLEARCDNVAEVTEAYRQGLRCVASAECEDLLSSEICQEEDDLYEAAKENGGEGCQPDDD